MQKTLTLIEEILRLLTAANQATKEEKIAALKAATEIMQIEPDFVV